MEPKLILLNGNPGLGKTTLAQRYVDERPMALNLDTDRLWFMMGQWQSERPRSIEQKHKFANAIADIHLQDGYDVVVPDYMNRHEQYAGFESVAKACGAVLHKLVLIAPIDEAVERCKARARSLGYESGFRPGGVLDTSGREQWLRTMTRDMMAVIDQKPEIVRIPSVDGDIQGTYELMLRAINT